MRGAIVAAGGPSRRMGRFKALIPAAGVPLVVRVIDAATKVVDEIVVVGKRSHRRALGAVLPDHAVLLEDRGRIQSPLVAILTGAPALSSEYVAFLACDVPLLAPELLSSLFGAADGHGAAVPQWPDGRIEPMVAVYRRDAAMAAARDALRAGERANSDMIHRLSDVVLVSTEVLRRADPDLESFANVNAPPDLSRVEALLRRRASLEPR